MFENNIHWLKFFSCVREGWDACIVYRYQISFLNSLVFAVIVLDIEVHNYLAIEFLKLNMYFQSK